MIKKIKDIIRIILEEEKDPTKDKIIILDPGSMGNNPADSGDEPLPLNLVGLFCDVIEEKVAEIVHALLSLNEANLALPEKERKPIEFYLSTYGGSADDMFALYDVMRLVRKDVTLRTIGLGKVMSAGVLLLAAGTKGERKIAKNCRIMIHSVVGGNQGDLHNMLNEMEAIEQLQQMFVDCLVSETKMTKSRLKKILDRKVNVYLSAEEAVELGIADIII